MKFGKSIIILLTGFLPVLFSVFEIYGQESKIFFWPVLTQNIDQKLSSLFGESRGDHFHNGIDISSDNEPVIAVENGSLVYSRYSSDSPFENEHGSGNSIWISHQNELLSAYYHLKDGREPVLSKKEIQKGEKIAKTGNTGHSSGSHLHFILSTEYGKVIVNPLKYFPQVEDKTSPNLGALTITTSKLRNTYVNDGDSINASRAFPVSIEIYDSAEKRGQRRGIAAVEYFWNGALLKKASFQEIHLDRGRWKNKEGIPFEELYFDGRYFLGDILFHSGENQIEVRVEDFNGNKSTKNFSFQVNRVNPKD